MKEKMEAFIRERGFEFIGEHNPRIKQVKSLISNTKPNPNKLFIAEGIWIHKKLIEFSTPVSAFFMCPEYIVNPETLSIAMTIAEKSRDNYCVSARVFDKLSERDKPDGLLAIAALPQHDINSFEVKKNSVVLVLDGIEIPGNIGTMLRMADGAGVDAVLICNRRARLTHPKLIKGSMGAALTVPVFEFENVSDCRGYLYKNGFTVYLADTRADKYYYDEPFGCNAALVMGSERYGITKSWYEGEYTMISIPMLGKCDSLNVGVAASVLSYEAIKKNKLQGKN